MAEFFLKGNRRKRTVTALSIALSLTLGMGALSACGGTKKDEEEDDPQDVAAETDTALLKNGTFEFYADKTKKDEDKRTLIYTPSDWSFTSGSPSSDTQSGIINLDEWDELATSKYRLVDDKEGEEATPSETAIANAVAHWEEASVYDRLEFLEKYKSDINALKSDSEAKKLFDKYNYSFDFEDVEALAETFTKEGKTTLAPAHAADDETFKDQNHLLMIHNSRTSDSVVGTGQYYTSGTTVTLPAGTAAEISVSVKTSELYHYYSSENDGKGTPVTANAGAYIGLTNTVGGTTLDQVQVKNINTKDEWQKYTFYVRANTYATTTFKLVLGLGQSSSDIRYEAVNGYAFFDDATCKLISSAEYDEAANDLDQLTLTSTKEERIKTSENKSAQSYALDLKDNKEFSPLFNENYTVLPENIGLTTEFSGSKKYTSLIGDNRDDGEEANSIAEFTSVSDLKANTTNKYLSNIVKNDFEKFPFANEELIMLLSTNGAAYTAQLPSYKVEAGEKMLLSFFVKTSSIRSGKTGASIVLVDGENTTSISAFDSTTVAKIDIDDDRKDILDGWVQCFFFVENTTEDDHTFFLKLSYGPTSVASSKASDYCDGYAAFANFETAPLTATTFKYVSTGNYAKTVSLTGNVSPTAKFDDAAITSDIENELASPVNFNGVQSGTANMVLGGHSNPSKAELNEEGLFTGLLNAKYADNYKNNNEAWFNTIANGKTDGDWWKNVFGDENKTTMVANQPLAIVNTSSDKVQPAYGFFAASTTTVSANSYRKISMNVKLSAGAKAYIYLIDTSDKTKPFNDVLSPASAKVTYYYDDEGNICTEDLKTVLFRKQDNGLYLREGAADGVYYANLHNYKTDATTGNLMTSADTVAYYKHGDEFYAYYDKDKTGDAAYTQVVKNLPTSLDGNSITRYEVSDETLTSYGSCIVVEGTNENANTWVEVAFYLHTGSESKEYRLEVWAGDRTCAYNREEGLDSFDKTTGIPANGYIFFDNYKSESLSSATDYTNILNERVSELKDGYNEGKAPDSEGYLGEKDNLPAKDALYSTFTFYDSPSYTRYDKTLDEDSLGDPHGSYKQSSYSEQLIALGYSSDSTVEKFIDYAAHDVSVPEDDLGNTDDDDNDDDNTATSSTNVWLLIASGATAGALIFVILAVLVRRIVKAARKNNPKTKRKKQPKEKKELRIVQDENEDEE